MNTYILISSSISIIVLLYYYYVNTDKKKIEKFYKDKTTSLIVIRICYFILVTSLFLNFKYVILDILNKKFK